MPGDPPTAPSANPAADQEAAARLTAVLREALGEKPLSSQQLRRIRAAADAVRTSTTPTPKARPSEELLRTARGMALTAGKVAIGQLIVAAHLRLLLRGLAAAGVPIPDVRLRTCFAITAGFGVVARSAWAAVTGEPLTDRRHPAG